MKIDVLNNDKYRLWDQFCLESESAWFWHTTNWLDYCVEYGKARYNTRNLSFYLSDDVGIVAICPLLAENREGLVEFAATGGGNYIAAPAFRNDLKEERLERIQKAVFSEIDRLAQEHKVKRALFRLVALLNNANYNWLLKQGYWDVSINSQVIDLSLEKNVLWNSVRKGHKYDINRGRKHYKINFFDKYNADKNIFDQYRLLHHKAAGRITRPVETFEMMYRWILAEEGMLCAVSWEDKYIGFSYISLYNKSAYYSSASDDPDFTNAVPISHIIQWSVIEWLKERGYRYYEIGSQQFGPLIYDKPSQKDINISLFKRGFGGKTVPLFRGEKFYDQQYKRSVFDKRVAGLCEFDGYE